MARKKIAFQIGVTVAASAYAISADADTLLRIDFDYGNKSSEVVRLSHIIEEGATLPVITVNHVIAGLLPTAIRVPSEGSAVVQVGLENSSRQPLYSFEISRRALEHQKIGIIQSIFSDDKMYLNRENNSIVMMLVGNKKIEKKIYEIGDDYYEVRLPGEAMMQMVKAVDRYIGDGSETKYLGTLLHTLRFDVDTPYDIQSTLGDGQSWKHYVFDEITGAVRSSEKLRSEFRLVGGWDPTTPEPEPGTWTISSVPVGASIYVGSEKQPKWTNTKMTLTTSHVKKLVLRHNDYSDCAYGEAQIFQSSQTFHCELIPFHRHSP